MSVPTHIAEIIENLPKKAGVYQYYDKNHKPIYIGRASGNGGKYGLKHRVSSYYQVDDFKEHPTKKALRPKIKFFSTLVVEDKKKRRAMEKELKKGLHGNSKLIHNHY